MKVNFKVNGIEKLKSFLAKLPQGTKRRAMRAVSEYLVGNDQRGLRHPQPYRYASRRTSYGFVAPDGAPAGYFSWKQFRYVAAITEGFTLRGSRRTGESTDAWRFTESSNSFKIVNDTPGGYYTRDDYGQAAQPANVGWRKVSDIIKINLKDAMAHAKNEINDYLRKAAK